MSSCCVFKKKYFSEYQFFVDDIDYLSQLNTKVFTAEYIDDPAIRAIATGNVNNFSLLNQVNAIGYSFHAKINTNIEVLAIDGEIKGININFSLLNTYTVLQMVTRTLHVLQHNSNSVWESSST